MIGSATARRRATITSVREGQPMSFTDQPDSDHRGDRVPGGALRGGWQPTARCALARSERKAEVLRETVSRWYQGRDRRRRDGAGTRGCRVVFTPLPTLAGMSASGWSTSRDANDRRRSSGRRERIVYVSRSGVRFQDRGDAPKTSARARR
ncbi:MAG: hypothetical protein U0521_29885 [Anaerolineae bacterium]